MKKEHEYTGKISTALGAIFDEDSEVHISEEELKEGDNLVRFIHALANLAPTMLFNEVTGSNKNILEFNHEANKLCFQYTTKTEDDK